MMESSQLRQYSSLATEVNLPGETLFSFTAVACRAHASSIYHAEIRTAMKEAWSFLCLELSNAQAYFWLTETGSDRYDYNIFLTARC